MKMIKTTPAQSINLKGRIMTFDRPIIMGILNVTPDSFFDGGQNQDSEQIISKVQQLLNAGADIIDIGAYSSRPGATLITSEEELERALPAIRAIAETFPDAILSIDTFRADVAEACVHAGVHMINDVSGGTIDSKMFETVAKLQVPYVLMHMRGVPENMQQLTQYQDIVTDVATYFGEKIATLRKLGVKDIILDPGYGFAKTVEQNYELLHRVDELHYFGLPILGGISRKSMIYKKLDLTPQEALNGTTVLNTMLLSKGVQLLRVHDVKEAKQIVDLLFQ